jgi:hypothetical protein
MSPTSYLSRFAGKRRQDLVAVKDWLCAAAHFRRRASIPFLLCAQVYARQ